MKFKKLLMIALFSFGLVNSAFANTENNKSVTHQPATAKRTFNQLTKKQQNQIIQLEKSFKPELRAEVREFLFNDKKQTVENLALILNKQLGSKKYVRVKDGLIEFHYLMPSNELKASHDKLMEFFSLSIYKIDNFFLDGIIGKSFDNMLEQTFFNLENNITKKELEEQALDEAMEFHKQGNYIEAADLFEILAEDGGNSIAQIMLGSYYLKGFGVKQDIGKTKKYWKLACNNGEQQACELYKKLTQ